MQHKSAAYPKLDRPEVLRFLFHPRKDPPAPPVPVAVDYSITVDTGTVLTCRFYAAGPQAPAILFFHGNGETVDDYEENGLMYNRLGIGLLAVEYRGYGRSTGTPTASALIADAHAVLAGVKKWRMQQKQTGPLYVMGRSLGSAPAIELAAQYEADIAGLIIESGFAYTEPLLRFLGVDTKRLGITEADCFGNFEKIKGFKKPLLLMHAQFDQFIPVSDAELLLKNCPARRKQLQVIPGADHNSILRFGGSDYFKFIKNFINGK
jgi:alpha-beta hydrolase superfamily lysophospholipase